MRYVRLWAHPGCPGGKRAKRYLEHHGILYKETPLLGMNLPDNFLIISPIIRVGDHLLCGFDPEEFWSLYRKNVEDGQTVASVPEQLIEELPVEDFAGD